MGRMVGDRVGRMRQGRSRQGRYIRLNIPKSLNDWANAYNAVMALVWMFLYFRLKAVNRAQHVER